MAEEKTQSNGKTNMGFRGMSALLQRMQLAMRAGLQFGGKRDLYGQFGYKLQPTEEDLLIKYQRQDITSRIVDAPPAATWSNPPGFQASDAFKDKWTELNKKHKIWTKMERADRLARLNYFSLMIFGFDDASHDRPLGKRSARELLYIKPVGSRLVKSIEFEDDPTNARYGLPRVYEIEFEDPGKRSGRASNISMKMELRNVRIHHSRVVHIVENPLEDETIGTPVIEKVYNLLDDLLKTAGGSAETYWLTANRGMQANIDKDMDIDPQDAADLSDELEEYQHQLRRIIRTRGIDLKVLENDIADPGGVFDMIIALISGTTGIPRRILLGSEAGQLASEQDRANWAERIDERRALYAEPVILAPSTELLMTAGALPTEKELQYLWPEAFHLSPLERSQTMAATARAVGNLSRQTGNKTPMQITSQVESRAIIGLDGPLPDEEIRSTGEALPAEEIEGGAGSEIDDPSKSTPTSGAGEDGEEEDDENSGGNSNN